jgi:hypothetical protein
MSVAQKVIEILEAKKLPFTSVEVEGVIRRYDLRLEGSVEDLIEEVVAEGVKRSVKVLESFSDTFKVSLPIGQMEELFWRRGWVYVRGSTPLEVQTRGANGGLIDTLHPRPSAPHPELSKEIELYVRPGLVKLHLGHSLQAVRGRALFKGYSEEELEHALEDVKRLSSFLPVLELEDLPQALERLRALDAGESRLEGPYVLTRGAGVWLLRRGPIFGDPDLDGAVLRGERVALSFPGDVEATFRIDWYWEWEGVGLQDFRIRWRREVVYLGEDFGGEEWGGGRLLADSLEKNPVAEAIRARLEQEVYFYQEGEERDLALSGISPRMWAFLRVLAEREDPLAFLAEGKFGLHVTAVLFGDL